MTRGWALVLALGLGVACNKSQKPWRATEPIEEEAEEDPGKQENADREVVIPSSLQADGGVAARKCDFHMLGLGRTALDTANAGDTRTRASTCILGIVASDGSIRTQNPQATSCRGDSGAPLIRNGTREVVGVLWGQAYGARGKECEPGPANFVDFTPVGPQRDWIDTVLAENQRL